MICESPETNDGLGQLIECYIGYAIRIPIYPPTTLCQLVTENLQRTVAVDHNVMTIRRVPWRMKYLVFGSLLVGIGLGLTIWLAC